MQQPCDIILCNVYIDPKRNQHARDYGNSMHLNSQNEDL